MHPLHQLVRLLRTHALRLLQARGIWRLLCAPRYPPSRRGVEVRKELGLRLNRALIRYLYVAWLRLQGGFAFVPLVLAASNALARRKLTAENCVGVSLAYLFGVAPPRSPFPVSSPPHPPPLAAAAVNCVGGRKAKACAARCISCGGGCAHPP